MGVPPPPVSSRSIFGNKNFNHGFCILQIFHRCFAPKMKPGLYTFVRTSIIVISEYSPFKNLSIWVHFTLFFVFGYYVPYFLIFILMRRGIPPPPPPCSKYSKYSNIPNIPNIPYVYSNVISSYTLASVSVNSPALSLLRKWSPTFRTTGQCDTTQRSLQFIASKGQLGETSIGIFTKLLHGRNRSMFKIFNEKILH